MQQSAEMNESYQTISERKPSNEQTSNLSYPLTELQEELSMMQKATLIVDNMTNQLCKEIIFGNLWVENQEKDLPIERPDQKLTKNQALIAKMEEVDLEEHRRKIKTLMQANKRMRMKRSQRTLELQKFLQKSVQEEQKLKEQQKQQELNRRKSLIESRMASKAQMMAKIRQMSIESDERYIIYYLEQIRVKSVRSKKFLYEQKQEEFKVNFLLPKIEEEKKTLEHRKDKMKSMDMNLLFEHEKSYEMKRKINSINRSMTSRFIQSENAYNPPEYVPKSFLLYAAEEQIKKQQKMLKIKEAERSKEKVKEFVKNISEIHKLEKEISKSRSKSPEQKFREISPSKQEKKKKKQGRQKKKQLSKEELTNVGNQYFKLLLEDIKKARQKRLKKQKQKQEVQKSQAELEKNTEDDLQIQIRSEEIRTIHKIEKIQKNYQIRSKKIQSIFNDSTIDPFLKYEKLKHQVQNLDMVLKTKNLQSEDIKQRTQAAGSYMTAIKAKLKLLEVSNNK